MALIGLWVFLGVMALLVAALSLVAAASLSEARARRTRREDEIKALTESLGSSDPLDAAFRSGGAALAVRLAFCRLLISGCLQVEEGLVRPSPDGPVGRRCYRLRESVDTALLHPVEQAVAGLLTEYRSFGEIVHEGADALQGYVPVAAPGTEADRADPSGAAGLAKRCRQLLEKAEAGDKPVLRPCGV